MRKDLKLSQAVGDPLPGRDPARARPAAGVLRPRHPDLALQLGEPAGASSSASSRPRAGGETALLDAITVYMSRVVDTPGRKVLVLFTDGDDTTSRIPQAEVMRLVRSTEVTIYPVAFTGDQRPNSASALRARALLHALAELDRRPRVRAVGLAGARRHLRVRSSTSSAASTCWATCRTTRDATASSAASASGSSRPGSRSGTARATTAPRSRRRRAGPEGLAAAEPAQARPRAGLSGTRGRAATPPCAPARAAGAAAPAASRTRRST